MVSSFLLIDIYTSKIIILRYISTTKYVKDGGQIVLILIYNIFL